MINLNKQNVIALEKRAQALQRTARAEEIIAQNFPDFLRFLRGGLEPTQNPAKPPPLPKQPDRK